MDVSTILEFDRILPFTKARLLTGPAGLGKSSVVKTMAAIAGARVVDLRLSELEPADLVGLPFLEEDESGKITSYARPHWWPTDPDEKVYLFLDEIDRCRDDMHPAAMQLTLDRRAGGRNLHDNVIVWAACNGPEYMTAPIDQALMDRFAVIEFTPSVEDWILWASSASNSVHPAVISFISDNKQMLDTPAELIGKPNVICASRRSWAHLGECLNNLVDIKSNPKIGKYATAFVGLECAAAFEQWIRQSFKTFSADDIFSGRADPERLSILEVSSAAKCVADEFMKRPIEQQKTACNFFIHAGRESFASFFVCLPAEASMVLMSIPEAHRLILKLRESI